MVPSGYKQRWALHAVTTTRAIFALFMRYRRELESSRAIITCTTCTLITNTVYCSTGRILYLTLWIHETDSFISLASKGSPVVNLEVCVSACTQKTPNLRCSFLRRRLTITPQRHRLADDQLSSLYPPSLSFSSFGTASVMLCHSPTASSSKPSRPSVHYPISISMS